MYRQVAAALFAAGALAGSAQIAVAAGRVEKSANTYHVAVCPNPVGNGYARCHAHVVTDASGRALATQAGPDTTPRGYGPSDLQSAYAVTTPGSSTITVAIVDAFGYTNAESDLAVYRTQYGLPPCTTANGCFKKLNEKGHPGPYPAQNTGWAQESALDLDMVSAMCPNCKIILVEANNNNDRHLGNAVDTAVAKGAHVVSNSYGGPEAGTMKTEKSYTHAGVAITASTGDSGYGAQFPATSPHVTAVGGTTLTKASNARGWGESAWTWRRQRLQHHLRQAGMADRFRLHHADGGGRLRRRQPRHRRGRLRTLGLQFGVAGIRWHERRRPVDRGRSTATTAAPSPTAPTRTRTPRRSMTSRSGPMDRARASRPTSAMPRSATTARPGSARRSARPRSRADCNRRGGGSLPRRMIQTIRARSGAASIRASIKGRCRATGATDPGGLGGLFRVLDPRPIRPPDKDHLIAQAGAAGTEIRSFWGALGPCPLATDPRPR